MKEKLMEWNQKQRNEKAAAFVKNTCATDGVKKQNSDLANDTSRNFSLKENENKSNYNDMRSTYTLKKTIRSNQQEKIIKT